MSTGGNVDKIEAGEAFVRATVVDETKEPLARLERDFRAWGQSISDIGKGVVGAGLAIGGAGLALLTPLLGAVARTEALGSALVDMSARTGASVESLGALRYAAEQSDVAFEGLGNALAKMQKLLGSDADKKPIEDLGLDPAALLGMNAEEQFRTIADRIAKIENPAQRAAAAMAVFGKSGKELLPLLNLGSDGIGQLMQRAEELGLVMDTQTALAAESWGDAWGTLVAQFDHVVAEIGAALVPTLQQLADSLGPILADVISFVKQNQGLVVAVAASAAGLVAFGAVVTTVGAALVALGTAMQLVLSPVTLVAVGVAGITAALIAATDSWGDLATFVKSVWGPVGREAVTMGTDIKDALFLGNTADAWELFLLNMRASWQAFTNAWHEGVTIMVEGVINAIKVATADLLAFFSFSTATTNDQLKAWDKFGVEWLDSWKAANAERARNLEETERRIREIRDRSAAEESRRAVEAEAAKPKPPDLVVYLEEPLTPFAPPRDRNGKLGYDLLDEMAKTDWGDVAKSVDTAFSAIGTTSADVAARITGYEVDWTRRTADNTKTMADTLEQMNEHLERWGPALFA